MTDESARLSYCAREVRRHDHDRYLSCVFAPDRQREGLFALYAFNLEVARIAESVSEEILGQIRLQWWREAIEGIYVGRPRNHEVVLALSETVQTNELDRSLLDRLIDGRAFDLDKAPPHDHAAWEAYAEATSSGLIVLALQSLGVRGDSSERFAHHLGLAWAMTGHLKAIPFHAVQRRLYLPSDLLQACGVELGDLFELRASSALNQAVEQSVEQARKHLTQAREIGRELPKSAASIRLLRVLADRFLRDLATVGYNPFDQKLARPRPGAVWRLAMAHLLKRY